MTIVLNQFYDFNKIAFYLFTYIFIGPVGIEPTLET